MGEIIPEGLLIVVMILIFIAICFGMIAAKKGKNPFFYGVLSIIPILNLILWSRLTLLGENDSTESQTQINLNKLEDEEAIEFWKYYANVGGADKDRMVQIVTWLLGFSAAIIGVFHTKNIVDAQKIALSSIGILISLFAILIVYLYTGHVDRNWKKADEIAKAKERLAYLIPESKSINWFKNHPGIFTLFYVLTILSLFYHAYLLYGI